MSKTIGAFFTLLGRNFNMTTKFMAQRVPGSRIVPSKTPKHDENYQLRIDAGELIDDRFRNVYLQVNADPKNTGLKDWVRANGTHAKLATETFDTKAEDPEEETSRVLKSLEEKAKNSI
jgi:hypothetical protein